jgi:hypothetical protein
MSRATSRTVLRPAPRPGVKDDRPYRTAKTFLAALDPTSERWTGGTWIFRGHANATWELKPSGAREADAYAKCGFGLANKGRLPAWSVRKFEQDALLADFARRLDEAGFTIPVEPPKVRDIPASQPTNAEPLRRVFPLMALAQHHRLPTLLLDWTRRPRFAAYFAAAGVVGHEGDPKLGTHLAVMALHLERAVAAVLAATTDEHGQPGDAFLELYQAPAGTNPNMRAQAGLFTLLSTTSDNCIEPFLAKYVAECGDESPLQRLVLPHAEARKLLRLLSAEGIDGASMFPGADGVASAIRETALWSAATKRRFVTKVRRT